MKALPANYGELVSELFDRAARHRQPVLGSFELTSRCNLACRMCYIRNPAGDRVARQKELAASAWLSLACQARDNGMVFLLLTGGEALLRQDFFDIYEPLTRMGLMLTLFTNGTLISGSVADRLAEAPPSRIDITLYGATAATYEAVTGVAGSYARCCAGIEAIVKRRLSLKLKSTIIRRNASEVKMMRQMAHNWGVPYSAGCLLTKRRDGTPSDVENCRLSASECIALEATDRSSDNGSTEAPFGPSSVSEDPNFYCHAGKTSFVVTAAGNMNACLDLALPAARPIETGFPAAWEQVQRYVDSAPLLAPACRACDARVYCSRCPAWSALETNTLTDPVPYLCEIARARKERYARHA